MNEEEKVVDLLFKINETFNSICNLGEDVDDKYVVKILISLLSKYDLKIPTRKEENDIKKYSMDDLHGGLTTYKTYKEESSNREYKLSRL